MYLVELDPFTGLVKIDGEFDGVRAVKEFREVINDEKLGVECFTAIALTVDYLTPIGFYKEGDRPYKAMELATKGNRRAFIWDQDLIQKCLIRYDELQYNPVIEEKRTLDFMLLEKLKEINLQKEANTLVLLEEATSENIKDLTGEFQQIKRLVGDVDWNTISDRDRKSLIRKANIYVVGPENRKREEEHSKKNEERMMALFKQLGTIKTLIESFNKNNEANDIYKEGPVRNGYKLTRLEEKAQTSTSFYHKNR